MVPKAVRRYTFSRSPRATHVNANPIRERRRPPGRQSGRKMAMSVANPSNRRHRHRDFLSRSRPGGGRRDCHDGAPFSRNVSAGRRRLILSRVDRPGSTESANPVPAILEKLAGAAPNLLSKCSSASVRVEHVRRTAWRLRCWLMLRGNSRSVGLVWTVRFSSDNINKYQCFRTDLPDGRFGANPVAGKLRRATVWSPCH
jgi:hypothetical protein